MLTPDIFEALASAKPGKSNEIWLTDAIRQVMEHRPVYACEIEGGKYFDTGNKLEYMKTVVEFALQHKEIGPDFKDYIKNLDIRG